MCLFRTSSLSHVKQWFVHPYEAPAVMITFPVCHTDLPWCCLFWLSWYNGCLLCLIRVSGSRSTPFFLAPFLTVFVSLLLPSPSLFLHPAEEEVIVTLTQLSSSHPITVETKRVLFFWTIIRSTPGGVLEEGNEGVKRETVGVYYTGTYSAVINQHKLCGHLPE